MIPSNRSGFENPIYRNFPGVSIYNPGVVLKEKTFLQWTGHLLLDPFIFIKANLAKFGNLINGENAPSENLYRFF